MIAANSWTATLLKQDWLFFCEPLKKYRTERIGRIASNLALLLSSQPRLDIPLAQKHIIVLTTRRFLKDLKVEDPRISECRKQLLAMKLAIDADVFDANPGFQKFASKYHLERYMMEYRHSLTIDPESKKISILKEGKLEAWQEKMALNVPKQKEGHPSQPWIYGADGLQNQDMYNWSELMAFKNGNPADWGHRYIFEFCAICSASPQKTGDHSWFRLKTPSGEIYSIGLYRPGKGGLFDNLHFPLRVKEGYLMQPDVSEFWPGETQTIPFEITQNDFLEMKRVIEEDKKHDKQVFQLLQSNCVLYTKKIARIAKIEIPTAVSVARLLTPKALDPAINAMCRVLPNCIIKVVSAVCAFFYNLVQLALGAGRVDEKVKDRIGRSVQPHLASIRDVFSISKAELHHPNTLGHKTRLFVENWRNQEIAKLEKQINTDNKDEIKKQIDSIRYSRTN